ncbi:MAG: hypothetical protein AAFV47_13325 [Pseudomonadota bacterium]
MSDREHDDHWLARATTIRLIRRLSLFLLVVVVAVQWVVPIKGYFAADQWFGFGAVFGFLACLVMVLFAKAVGFAIKRPEDYYSEDAADD